MQKLKHNTSYINTWNYFSKGLIIQENLNEKKNIILVVEKENYINIFESIFFQLKIEISHINTISNLVNIKSNKIWLYIILSDNLDKTILSEYQITQSSIKLEINQEISEDTLIKKLNEFWYSFNEYEKAWTYKKMWDIITITDPSSSFIYKISFWWDKIEEIIVENKYKDIKTNQEKLEELTIWSRNEIFLEDNKDSLLTEGFSPLNSLPKKKLKNPQITLIDYLKDSFFILDNLDFYKNYEKHINTLTNFCCFDIIWNKKLKIQDLKIDEPNIKDIDSLREVLRNNETNKIIFTKNIKLIEDFINYNNLKKIKLKEATINTLKSFQTKNELQKIKDITICDDIISKIFIKKRVKRKLSKNIDLLLKIKAGDYVVHIDHGIWIFNWIVKKELWEIKNEYAEICYKDNWKLFVPVTESSRLSKYVWVENPKLTPLGSKEWEKKIKKVSEDVELIAEELLETFAERKKNKWYKFINYPEKQSKFQNLFPYTYTDDQDKIIEDIIKDMSEEKTMDRLLVWDVSFWKTEIAFNAIYNCLINKKQAILIAPLVVLAYEHYEKARERFRWLWLKIKVLTRLESAKDTSTIIKELREWKIDFIIWTHKLLSESIEFKDLWLLVVDEEHKFWVKDKEKIKKYKAKIDILSMSATPIPRSLNMALASIRDISILRSPPPWRKSIKTYVSKFSDSMIQEAWKKEFERWGQIFFIHNKVRDINIYKNKLQEIFPSKKIIITHGQLEWTELEKRIIAFKNRKYDILLSTTVIENWVDFSNVNTIFINNCENFGISQIHQLRWRVWRSERQAYCHLLYKKENIWTEAAKRIKTIVEYSYLWAWFELAMKDLEIRGSWDILWVKQSGHASIVWINLFIKMLEDKIEKIKKTKDKTQVDNIDIKIDLGLNAYLPDSFFLNESDKLNFYREIESLNKEEDLDNLIDDFKKVNDYFSEEVENLFDLLRLKIRASKFSISSIKKIWINYQIDFSKEISLEKLKEFLKLDREVNFTIINVHKLRSSTKNFANNNLFLQYLLQLLNSEVKKKSKIRLKKKIV